MTRILMICLGNICRSPLAEGLLQSKLPNNLFDVDSAGTGAFHIGNSPDPRSIAVARKHGLDISGQKCRQFKVEDFDVFDHIFVMDASNYRDITKLARNQNDVTKVALILDDASSINNTDVPDPYHGGNQDFEKVYHLLDEASDIIVERLL